MRGRPRLPDRLRNARGRIMDTKNSLCECGRPKWRQSDVCGACYDVRRRVRLSQQCRRCHRACRAVYCSRNCQLENYRAAGRERKTRTCRGCGRAFARKHNRNRGLYCSRECAFANWRDWTLIARMPSPPIPRAPRQCAVCGSELPARRLRYCSDACLAAQSRRNRWARQVLRAHVCPACATTYHTSNARRVYCSRRCWRAMRTYRLGGIVNVPIDERNRLAGMMADVKAFNRAVQGRL